jgi:hypothetical protein
MVTESQGGVLLVESKPEREPEPIVGIKPPGVKCAFCDNRSNEPISPLQRFHDDGFRIHDPCCKHSSFATCPDCTEKFLIAQTAKYPGCPVCGEQSEYT